MEEPASKKPKYSIVRVNPSQSNWDWRYRNFQYRKRRREEKFNELAPRIVLQRIDEDDSGANFETALVEDGGEEDETNGFDVRVHTDVGRYFDTNDVYVSLSVRFVPSMVNGTKDRWPFANVKKFPVGDVYKEMDKQYKRWENLSYARQLLQPILQNLVLSLNEGFDITKLGVKEFLDFWDSNKSLLITTAVKRGFGDLWNLNRSWKDEFYDNMVKFGNEDYRDLDRRRKELQNLEQFPIRMKAAKTKLKNGLSAWYDSTSGCGKESVKRPLVEVLEQIDKSFKSEYRKSGTGLSGHLRKP